MYARRELTDGALYLARSNLSDVDRPDAQTQTGSNASKKGGSRAGSPAAGAVGQGQRMRKETDADQIDFNKKILHMSWHPFEDSIAIAATNNVSLDISLVNHLPQC